MAVQIKCVDKPSGNTQDPHEAISQYGWVDEVMPTAKIAITQRPAMVKWVKEGGQACVKDIRGNKAYCQVRKSSNGTEFLQTVTDGYWSDNLLSLPSCNCN